MSEVRIGFVGFGAMGNGRLDIVARSKEGLYFYENLGIPDSARASW